jgi:hypothetical protein
MKNLVVLSVLWLIAAVMLALAVARPPSIHLGGYGGRHYTHLGRSRSYSYPHSFRSGRNDFYTLLRWVCCAAFAYSAITAFQMRRVAWTLVFGILAVLFNPLAPVYLQRATWQIIDWAAIGVIVVAAIVFWRGKGTAAKARE